MVYCYAPGRGHIHAHALFGGYRGILQFDGYPANKKLFAGDKAGPKPDTPTVTLAFCWSHVRRGFYDEAKGGAAPIATEALLRIGALYEIDARVRGKSPAERLALRQAESCPLVADLRAWFETQVGRLPARSSTAEAIRCALNHWGGLERFLADGRESDLPASEHQQATPGTSGFILCFEESGDRIGLPKTLGRANAHTAA